MAKSLLKFPKYPKNYDPTTGRFTTPDPIGLAGGLNRYVYVEGNPLSYIDPEGTSPVFIAIGLTGLIGGTTSAIGTATQGGNFSQIAQSFGVGFIGGAGAATIAIFSGGSALAGYFGAAADLGITLLMLPTNLPNNATMSDVGNGINAINHPPSCKQQ